MAVLTLCSLFAVFLVVLQCLRSAIVSPYIHCNTTHVAPIYRHQACLGIYTDRQLLRCTTAQRPSKPNGRRGGAKLTRDGTAHSPNVEGQKTVGGRGATWSEWHRNYILRNGEVRGAKQKNGVVERYIVTIWREEGRCIGTRRQITACGWPPNRVYVRAWSLFASWPLMVLVSICTLCAGGKYRVRYLFRAINLIDHTLKHLADGATLYFKHFFNTEKQRLVYGLQYTFAGTRLSGNLL